MQKVDNKEVKLLVNTKSARKGNRRNNSKNRLLTNSTYKIILSYHLNPEDPRKRGAPLSPPLPLPLPVSACSHRIIIIDTQPQLRRILCKKCHHELKRWILKSTINFEELMARTEYVFGEPSTLDYRIAHELK